MKKFLIAVLLGCAAPPAQAADIFSFTLSGSISGFRDNSNYGGQTPGIIPIGPIDGPFTITGSWDAGFSSFYYGCSQPGCLKASFSGNQIVLRANGSIDLPCYCTETITLNFNYNVSPLSGLSNDNFVGGTYSFSEGTRYGGTILNGAITAVSFPVPGTVPEPATWAMMIAGFGLAGAAMRRHTRQQINVPAFA